MKKESILYILIAIVVPILFGTVTAYATSYLYNSEDVSYNNSSSGLSATTAKDAVDELYAKAVDFNALGDRVSNLEGTNIPTNTNLNTYSTTGRRFTSASATAQTLSNSPSTIAFTLNTFEPAVHTQLLTTYSSSFFKRYYNNWDSPNYWSNWKEFSPDSSFKNIVSIQSVNTTSGSAITNTSSAATTGTITAVSGATYHIVPLRCNFGFPTNGSISGTTLTVNAINASGGTHSMTCTSLVFAVK